MQTLSFANPPRRVLWLGAHSDDIEIGCGGTLLRLFEAYPEVEVRWAVFGAREQRAAEARRSAEAMLERTASPVIDVFGFRDGFFPYQGADIKDCFETLKSVFTPDVVFTHQREDAHQDHRLLNELTWNTYRNNFILEYEIPKYDGDFGAPNMFVHVNEDTARAKIDHLMSFFATQRDKHWFTPDLFSAVLRIRVMESASPSGLAEAFYCRKITI